MQVWNEGIALLMRKVEGLCQWNARALITGLAIFQILIVPLATQAATTAGAIDGQFAVGPTGAANYNIPIVIPPGITGMAPSLALVYNSQGGNGLLGMGWGLSGLSVITRCAKTYVQDGVKQNASFSNADKYCLDGQRLVLVSGVYGGVTAEYRTERDSFSKIISYGAVGTTGPAYFKVWSKAGQIIEYGNTPDSAIEVQGKVAIRVWAINKVSDIKKNYLTVNYNEDNANGQYYPTRIDYTGNPASAPVLTPGNSVQFLYAARPDIITQYSGDAMVKTTVRLTNIQTHAKVNGTDILVKDYRLAYDPDTSATNRSRLLSLIECDGASVTTCLKPTTLTWQATSLGFRELDLSRPAMTRPTGGADLYGFPKSLIGDFNGDGKMDRLWQPANGDGRWLIAYGAGTGLITPDYATPALPALIGGHSTVGTGHLYGGDDALANIGDFNGDGRSDYMWQPSDGDGRWLIAYGAETGFILPDYNSPALPAIVSGHKSDSPQDYHFVFQLVGDFNGDGRADYMWKPSDGDGRWLIAYGAATGFALPDYSKPALPALPVAGWRSFKTGDFNGDGKSDFIWSEIRLGDWLSSGIRYIVYGTENGLTTPDYANPALPAIVGGVYTYESAEGDFVGDFNGDGKSDLLYRPAFGYADGRWLIAYGTDTGLSLPDYSKPALPATIGGYSTSRFRYIGWPDSYEAMHEINLVADFNSDGFADYIWQPGNGDGRILIAYGTATGLSQPDYNNPAFPAFPANPVYPTNPAARYFSATLCQPICLGDFNGDGKPDFLLDKYDNSAAYIMYSNMPGKQADALTTVSNGLGHTITLSYKPLTDDTVYTKGNSSVYPVKDMQVPMYVVANVSASNGVGGSNDTSYTYATAKMHLRGGGFLGFGQITDTDTQAGILTTNFYGHGNTCATSGQLDSQYPFCLYDKGLLLGYEKRSNAIGTPLLKQVSNTWDFVTNIAWGSQYHAPQLKQINETNYDLVANGSAQGPILTQSTTCNSYDGYGNNIYRGIWSTHLANCMTPPAKAGLFVKETSNTYLNDTTNWFLGRLKRATVTSNTPYTAPVLPVAPVEPTLSSITPNMGVTTGGTTVVLTGTHFASGATVTIGGVQTTGCSVTSSTSITCTTPPGTVGARNVVLSLDRSSVMIASGFTYQAPLPTLTTVTPNVGGLAGGMTVTLTGTNFATGATATIGGTAATGCNVISSTSMTCITPVGTAGVKSVVVTVGGSSVTKTSAFTYQALALTSLTPNTGSVGGGTAITLTGTGFAPGMTLTINAVAATNCTFVSATSMRCTTPAGTAGAKSAVISVGGKSVTKTSAFTYMAPTLTTVAPTTGSVAGGTLITLTGTYFAKGATVTVGGVAATGCSVVSATRMTCTTPAGTAGAKSVVVKVAGSSVTKTSAFTYAAPTLTTVTPNTGATAGGTVITLTGTNFATGATVTVGGVAATRCSVASATSMTCTTPAGTAGAKNVVVTVAGSSVTKTSAFTYQSLAIAPNVGSFAGGTPVTLTGTGFVAGATVTIGGATAAGCTVVSSTSITCTSPAGTAGAKDVVVTSGGTPSTLAGGFTYQTLALTSASPNIGSVGGGATVTLTGSGFAAGATATVGGSAATGCTVASSTTMTCITPAGTAGAKSIVVTVAGSSVTLTNGFTYQAPTLIAISPTSGSVGGGSAITLTGTNFAAGSTATIGGVAATGCNVASPTSMTCTTPAGTAGAKNVVVTVAGTSVTLTNAYTYIAPTLAAIAPVTGSTSGGTSVTLTGTNFVTGTTATLGGVAMTGCTVANTTSMTCLTPANTAGVKDVAIAIAGNSVTLPGGFTYIGPTLTSIAPASGGVGGGTTVTLTGTNFVIGATVTIGGVAATGCTVASPTSMLCNTPANSAGAKDVVLSIAGSNVTLAGAYTYQAPTLNSVSPNSGVDSGGTSIVLTGSNFAAGATVTIGGVAATNCNVANSTSMTCITAANSIGTKNVVLTVAGSSVTLAGAYTYFVTPFNFAPAPISENLPNYNLRAAAIAAGWDQVRLLNATVTVKSGVFVYSNDTAMSAFSTGGPFPAGSTLTLVNNGTIVGKGGAGGGGVSGSDNGQPGGAGGAGMSAQFALNVLNYGIIAGGGGGGGGGGSATAGNDQGGGGCWWGVGGGGIGNGSGGTPGTLTAPGQGSISLGGSSPGADWYCGQGGAGGGYGQSGQAGGDGSAYADGYGGVYSYGVGGTGGPSGAAVIGSGYISWQSGNDSAHIKGALQ